MKKKNLKDTYLVLATIGLTIPALGGCGNVAQAASNAETVGTQSISEQTDNGAGISGENGNDQTVETNLIFGTDPVTGEKYPEEIKIAILNGSSIDAIANAEGYYDVFEEKTGVKTTILYFESGRDVNNAYASNSVDVATFGSSPITLGTTNELGYEVVFLNATIGESEALAVRSDIQTPEQLSGKTIATPFASTSHFSLLNYLNSVGVADVQVIDLQPQDILAAWQRGDIDGAYVWPPVLAEIENEGNVLVTSADLAADGIITADLTTAYKTFSQKYPTLVTEYLDIQSKVYDVINNDRERAVADLEDKLQIDEETAKKQLEGSVWISPEDQVNEKYLGSGNGESGLANTIRDTAEFHVTQGNLERAKTLEEYNEDVNPLYIQRLLEK